MRWNSFLGQWEQNGWPTQTAPRLAPQPVAYTPIPTAPPGWYRDVTMAIGDKMWDATNAPCGDAFWLDRLAEFLQAWAKEIERRAVTCRGLKPLI